MYGSTFYWIAVAVVIVVSSARLSRLLVIDKFPPIKRVRTWYETKTDGTDWQWLTMCGYCMSVWTVPVVMALGDLAGIFDNEPVVGWFTTAWWLIFGGLAAAYAAGIVMAYDGDEVEV